jgi:hypothetical protein
MPRSVIADVIERRRCVIARYERVNESIDAQLRRLRWATTFPGVLLMWPLLGLWRSFIADCERFKANNLDAIEDNRAAIARLEGGSHTPAPAVISQIRDAWAALPGAAYGTPIALHDGALVVRVASVQDAGNLTFLEAETVRGLAALGVKHLRLRVAPRVASERPDPEE